VGVARSRRQIGCAQRRCVAVDNKAVVEVVEEEDDGWRWARWAATSS
jgi:hypothetical protein